jgi:hypothetical protein
VYNEGFNNYGIKSDYDYDKNDGDYEYISAIP